MFVLPSSNITHSETSGIRFSSSSTAIHHQSMNFNRRSSDQSEDRNLFGYERIITIEGRFPVATPIGRLRWNLRRPPLSFAVWLFDADVGLWRHQSEWTFRAIDSFGSESLDDVQSVLMFNHLMRFNQSWFWITFVGHLSFVFRWFVCRCLLI